jgi:hypothetical protein
MKYSVELSLRLKGNDALYLEECKKLVHEPTHSKAIRKVLYLYPLQEKDNKALEKRVGELENEVQKLESILEHFKESQRLLGEL